MTRYDKIAGHPLVGVPQAVLNTTRAFVAQARSVDMNDVDDRHAFADGIVLALHERGYVTWPSAVPNRDALVLALMSSRHEWEGGQGAGDGSMFEHLVDDVILPLLRQTASGGVNNHVTNATGTVVQAQDVVGGVHLGRD